MERTISGMMGKGSVNHNSRKFTALNVDKERTKENIVYCNENIKQVYHEMFDGALARYNEKQTRSDRKIDNYYEKIRTGKQEKLFYEAIFQIGNKDDTNARSEEGLLAKNILDEFAKEFSERNPYLRVFSAHLHMDEETPHLHIDFIPFICDSKRGLDTRVSLKGALERQGFKGGSRGSTEWNQWMDSEKKALAKVMERYGIQWKQLGTHNKHLSVLDYEKQERTKEVIQLEKELLQHEIELGETVVIRMKEENLTELLKEENQAIKNEKKELLFLNGELGDKKKRLLWEKEKLECQQQKLQSELEKMVNSKAILERNVRAYDEEPRWQLPEPGTFMSANSYRESKALPLVMKLKEVVKNLTIKCIHLMEDMKRLTAKITGQEIQISNLTETVLEQDGIIRQLQDKAVDLERVKRFVGVEKVGIIVSKVKEMEKLDQVDRQPLIRKVGMTR